MTTAEKEVIEKELVKIITLGAGLINVVNEVLKQCGEAVTKVSEVLERTTKEGDV